MSWLAVTDPLFNHGVDFAVIVIVIVKCLAGLGLLMTSVIVMIWFERKVISDMQSRIGPQRWGPFGLLQTLADGLKLILKEDLIPSEADRTIFVLAPFLVLVPAIITFGLVPIGGEMTIAGHRSYSRSRIRRWESCCCSRCRASRSTESCSPGGPPVRNTPCSRRFVRALR